MFTASVPRWRWVNEGGEVLANRNVPNGVKPILSVIGGLPAGTPAAYEAAFGWGWLLELLEGHGFEQHMVHPLQCKAIASARLKNDKVDAATLAQLLRADLRFYRDATRRRGRPAGEWGGLSSCPVYPNRAGYFPSFPDRVLNPC